MSLEDGEKEGVPLASIKSRDTFFYNTFVDAAANLVEAVRLFRENVETLEKKEEYYEQIKRLETKGDEYTHLLIKELHTTFLPPMDREDLLQLIVRFDDVLDDVEACASRFVYLHVDQSTPSLVEFADLLEELARHLQDAFIALQKQEYEKIPEIGKKVDEIEKKADQLAGRSIGSLYEEPADPIVLIKMKDVYKNLEKATDSGKNLVKVLESVAMRYA